MTAEITREEPTLEDLMAQLEDVEQKLNALISAALVQKARLQRADELLARARGFVASIRSARADICVDRDKLAADITAHLEDGK